MFYSIFAVFLVLLLVVLIVKRPRLQSTAPASTVPDNLSLTELDQWVKHSESNTLHIVDGAEAMIEFADSTAPIKTSVCFLYVHGFSASRQETAPVTSEIASHYDANVFHARLAGHGVGSAGMVTSAESWLQSMVDAWKVAEYLGDEVVIVATSTGAPLTVWLLKQLGVKVIESYGMAETCGGCVYDGRALDGVNVEVIDGLVAVSGSTLANGLGEKYLSNDLGELQEGLLRVIGRSDRVIISGGKKVSLDAIERLVLDVPGVKEVMAVATQSQWGQSPGLLVVADGISENQIAADIDVEVKPEIVKLVQDLPRLSSGKPDYLAAVELIKD